MGPEDDGTPPAQHEGFLSNEVCSPSYRSSSEISQGLGGNYGYQPQEPRKGPAPGWKRYILPTYGVKRSQRRSADDRLDLVQLLEENWFWRSSSASPSLGETSTSSRHDSASSYSSRFRPQNRLPQSSNTSSANPASSSHSNTPFSVAGQRQERGVDLEVDLQESKQADSPVAQPAGATVAAKRSQSANIDDLGEGRILEPEPRARSYAQGAVLKDRQDASLLNPDPTLGDPLGTWAHRVFRFQPEHKASAPTHIPGTPDVDDTHPRQQKRASERPIPENEEDDDSAAMEAAWRWRFNRRWCTEQAKQLDPDFGMDGEDEDGWDEALGYLDACGPGFHLQIARTASADKNLAASSLVSNSSDLSNLMMDESQKEQSALKKEADMDATKRVVSMAKKAQDLYRHQQKIEQDVQTRWGNTRMSMSWAGQYLQAVRIDSYGQFPFILVKISDRTSAHRLLVRGKNSSSRAELMSAVSREARDVCNEHKLAAVSVALLGSGTMEWSRARDRRVDVFLGHMEKGCDPTIQSSDDVVRLAGALTRASLPTPNRVTVNGEKLS